MISSQSLTANSKILNVPDGNWRTWLRQTKIKLYTSHGDAGKQIIDETLIPLFPFASRPTKYDQERSINGSPILQFVYARLPSTEARPADLTDQEYFDSLLDLPLTAAVSWYRTCVTYKSTVTHELATQRTTSRLKIILPFSFRWTITSCTIRYTY
jgi:hypothetical protein